MAHVTAETGRITPLRGAGMTSFIPASWEPSGTDRHWARYDKGG